MEVSEALNTRCLSEQGEHLKSKEGVSRVDEGTKYRAVLAAGISMGSLEGG